MNKKRLSVAVQSGLTTGILTAILGFTPVYAKDYLVKWRQGNFLASQSLLKINGVMSVEKLGELSWSKVVLSDNKAADVLKALGQNSAIEYIQPNYPISIAESPSLAQVRLKLQKNPALRQKFQEHFADAQGLAADPAFPGTVREGKGPDPQFSQQWGMKDLGVEEAWKKTHGSREMVVAVLDTGVDYTHEDLVNNMWTNPGEAGVDAQGRDKATNGIDDDGNGFIDDVVGWDFVENDNKPFDKTMGLMDIITKGGNPGHGTHCAGNVAARGGNQKGISGVAPQVKIMAMRFLSEKGQGSTADALKAIDYAVKNGAKVLSNSWGSEGEDPSEGEANKALRDAITFAEEQGVLFIAAAGNGHQGVGYDNDSDAKPGYPASYDNENIVSVAALNVDNQLGAFSNWGRQSVDLGAPGVKIFSTIPGGKYQDTVLDFLGMKVTWDGTSMATPHVSGAAALYWSAYPEKSWREVKDALLQSTVKISALQGKSVTGGKLNVDALLKL